MLERLTIPGFVDLQVNGYVGVDFSSPDLTEDAFVDACRRLRATGTAAFLPTLITSPLEVYERNLPLIASVLARDEFRTWLPGLHIEGPFLSSQPGAVGAHNPDWTTAPSVDIYEKLLRWSRSSIKLFTLSPELPGADLVARAAVATGVAVSLGHTLATKADLERLTLAGARTFTHLGNALPAQLPKFANPIWPALANDDLTAMLIADGHHVTDDFLKAVIRAKGVERVIITSDASPVAGMPPGKYRTLNNDIVLEPNGRLHNPAKGFLVGSSATMLQCMNHLASLGILTLEELLKVGFHNPVKLVRIDPKSIPRTENVSYNQQSKRFELAVR